MADLRTIAEILAALEPRPSNRLLSPTNRLVAEALLRQQPLIPPSLSLSQPRAAMRPPLPSNSLLPQLPYRAEPTPVTADQYLYRILAREAVDTSATSPVLSVRSSLLPILRQWGGTYIINVSPSGSFAKGTANRSGTDIDLFISLASSTPGSLQDVHDTLFQALTQWGYKPKRQNVSLNVNVAGYDVDLVPGRLQENNPNGDYSLYRRRGNTWMKTNVARHIALVRGAGRTNETRILKLWRKQQGLEFLSFYLELTVIEALRGAKGNLSQNVLTVLRYLRDTILTARMVDPANTNNVVSDDLTLAEKQAIQRAATKASAATTWGAIVR